MEERNIAEAIEELKSKARVRISDIDKQIESLTEERKALAEHLDKPKKTRKTRAPKDPIATKVRKALKRGMSKPDPDEATA